MAINKYGVNSNIHGHILDVNVMKKNGFQEFDDRWSLFRPLVEEIELFVSLYKDNPEEICIEVIDDNFGQPYDYQHILEGSPNHKFATKIKNIVDGKLQKLQDEGIISGFSKDEYV